MPNFQFGAGVLIATPTAGNLAPNPTPTQLGTMQNASVEFKADLKKLMGQNQFAVATARGKVDVTGKASVALFDPNMMNQLFFGQSQAPGVNRMNLNESHTLAAGTAATITVINAAKFTADYGVINAATSLNMAKVPTAPAVGQYSASSAGVYTFNSAETATNPLISYLATDSANGTTITLENQLMGYAPQCGLFLYNLFRNKMFGIQLNNATFGQISIPTKQEDFWMMDVTFDCSCDASNILGYIYADQ